MGEEPSNSSIGKLTFEMFLKLICIHFIFFAVVSSQKYEQQTVKRWPTLDVIRSTTEAQRQANSVAALIRRWIGDRAAEFSVTIDPSLGPRDRDTYRIVSDETWSKIKILGSSGVAAALGFHNYLKQWCGVHVSWSGNQTGLPALLPVVYPPVQVTTNDRFRYYQNVCTVSYSFVWWDWTRWEREIDWMALSGINLPLAFGAQEAIWRRVYLRMNYTDKDLDGFFSGAAFLAWNRMGNVDGWGGPLSQNWHKQQMQLQHQILQRMRDLGMTPVLPAFSGHVPRATQFLFPKAKLTRMADWGKFNDTYCCSFLLDPSDPLFSEIGTAFLEEQIKEFGTNHIYNTDTFNEMTPPSSDPGYIASIGKIIFDVMQRVDSNAVWLMQGWLFNDPFWNTTEAKALLTSVPLGKMIVLDLQAEINPIYPKFQSFFGQPFIWCMLHNFGGVLGMYGAVEQINNGPFQGRNFPNSTMIGTGLTMEGIEQNDAIYELMNEMAWRNEPVDLDVWFADFAWRRYGLKLKSTAVAWQALKRSVFNDTSLYKNHGQYIIVKRPNLHLKPLIWYSIDDLNLAWDSLCSVAELLNSSSTFRYDLVDVTREVLQTLASQFYAQLVDGFRAKNVSAVEYNGQRLLDLLMDMEKVLASDEHFLLGLWIKTARDNGITEQEKDVQEYNARNQITLWGPTGNILDYATKQWSGIVKDYYWKRWQLFISVLKKSLKGKIPFKQDTFDELVFQRVEQPFTFSKSHYPIEPIGNTIQIVKQMHLKWRHQSDPRMFKKIKARFLKLQKRLLDSSMFTMTWTTTSQIF